MFYDNTGSAVLLRNSLLYVSGEVFFVKNKADVGAAINIQEGSRVRRKKWQILPMMLLYTYYTLYFAELTYTHTHIQVELVLLSYIIAC